MIHWNAILIALGFFLGMCFIKTRDTGSAVAVGGMQGACMVVILLGITGML